MWLKGLHVKASRRKPRRLQRWVSTIFLGQTEHLSIEEKWIDETSSKLRAFAYQRQYYEIIRRKQLGKKWVND